MTTDSHESGHGVTRIAEILALGVVRLRQTKVSAGAPATLAAEKPGNPAQNQLELLPETALTVTHGLTDPVNSVTRRNR